MKKDILVDIIPLKTERLIIRQTIVEDVDMLLKMDKQEITQRYLGGIKNKTREERILFLEKKLLKSKNNQLGSLTVCLLDETPIGFLEFNINRNDDVAEISYIFDLDYCRKGYCTEACRKIIDVGFDKLKLNKIFADTIDCNNSSKRVLEKLGFKLKGTKSKESYVEAINRYSLFLDYELIKK